MAPSQIGHSIPRCAYANGLLSTHTMTRLLYLDGQLLDAVKRSPPTVLGDGKSRISQLVESLNQRRLNAGYKLAQITLEYYMDMKLTL
jgi:hypothetical protein